MMLDFSKPLRTDDITEYPVEVVKEGVTLVRWDCADGRRMYAVVDERGNVQPTNDWRSAGFRIENVPEEPKDHLAIWIYEDRGYFIDDWSGEQLHPRSVWERQLKTEIKEGAVFLVKVPV